ncbi:MAG TPA: hypothetical protein VIT20_00565 [Propionibacteriaceae bacterium]
MVDMYQVVLGGIAVAVMVLVPIGAILFYDLLAGRWDESLKSMKERRSASAEHRRAVRLLTRHQGVPLERLVADLRRLRSAVGADAHRSAAHQLGNRMAYDQLLSQTCEMLEIEHELAAESAGFERDIERIRIEAELERAGVMVTDRRYGQAA